MINQSVLVGNLTKDPNLTFTPGGVAVCKFTVAVTRSFSGQNGEKETDFINCTAFKKNAENLANYQKKGNKVGVVGRIQTGSYENSQGIRIYTTDVIADSIQFLDKREDSQQQNSYQQPYQQNTQQNYNRVDEDPFANSKGPIEVNKDDLPF